MAACHCVKKYKGFTVAELLIASSIMLVVLLVAWQLVFPVFKVWFALERKMSVIRNIYAATTRIQSAVRDSSIHNVYVCSNKDSSLSDVLYVVSSYEKDSYENNIAHSESVFYIADGNNKDEKKMYMSKRMITDVVAEPLKTIASLADSLDVSYLYSQGWPKANTLSSGITGFKIKAESGGSCGASSHFSVFRPQSKAIPCFMSFKYLNEKGLEKRMVINFSAAIFND